MKKGTGNQNSTRTPEDSTKPASTQAATPPIPTPEPKKKQPHKRKHRAKLYDLLQVERLAAAGLSHAQLAECLDVTERTLTRLKKREDFAGAYKKGVANAIQHVEASLYLRCIGFHVQEGDKVKYFAPSDLAIMYYLNNKAPHAYKHASHIEQNLTQTIAFPDFDKLPLVQKRKVLSLMERKAKGEDIGQALVELQREIAVIQPGQQQ